MVRAKGVMVFVGFSLVLSLLGCGTSLVRDVNQAVLTARPSYTDIASRLVARQTLPLLASRKEDYRAGPEDLLEISIFEWELREETKTALFRISEEGNISLPVIGDLNVGGKTIGEIKKRIESALQRGGFIKQPRVSVVIKEYRSKRVAVVGAVEEPGVYTLRQNVTTLLDILSLAGGVSEKAGGLLYLIRTKPSSEQLEFIKLGKEVDIKETISVDLYELMEMGDLTMNMVIGNGDIVHVPMAKKYSVIGHVRNPGSFSIKKPTTVLEGIANAGGLIEKEASPRYCILKRRSERGSKELRIDLVEISRGTQPDIFLLPDDVIDVPQMPGKKLFLGILDFLKNVLMLGYTVNK